jgi:hypothetical protein
MRRGAIRCWTAVTERQIANKFASMRCDSRRRGKAVPTVSDLWQMASAVTALDGRLLCPTCGREMVWRSERGMSRSRVVSLQHDVSGAMRFLCLGCNVKHGNLPEDDFYGLPAGHKRCCRCRTVKPCAEFCADRSRPSGLKAHCRACQKANYEMKRSCWREWVRRRRARSSAQAE